VFGLVSTIYQHYKRMLAAPAGSLPLLAMGRATSTGGSVAGGGSLGTDEKKRLDDTNGRLRESAPAATTAASAVMLATDTSAQSDTTAATVTIAASSHSAAASADTVATNTSSAITVPRVDVSKLDGSNSSSATDVGSPFADGLTSAVSTPRAAADDGSAERASTVVQADTRSLRPWKVHDTTNCAIV
jgi:hypothetical protein